MKKLVCVLSMIAVIALLVPAITMAGNNVTSEIKSAVVSVERHSVTLSGPSPNNNRHFFVEMYEIWSATRVEVLLIGGDGFKEDQTVINKIVALAKTDVSIEERMKLIEAYLRTVDLETGTGPGWIQCPQGCF